MGLRLNFNFFVQTSYLSHGVTLMPNAVEAAKAMGPTGGGGGPKHPLLLFFVGAA